MGNDIVPDDKVGDHVDDDPTVFADDDLIRQIRAGAAARSGPSMPTPSLDGDSDATVFADGDLVRQIRTVAAAATSSNVPADEDDPTVVADDDLIRQVRQAAAAQPISQTAPVTRPIESGSDTSSTTEPVDDEHTVMAGEEVIRNLRIGNVSPASTPVQPMDNERYPRIESSDHLVEDEPIVSLERTDPTLALEELRERFAPESKKPTRTILPSWLIIAGIALLAILIVVVLAVVLVG